MFRIRTHEWNPKNLRARTSIGIQMLVDMQKWMPNESIHVLKMRPKQLCLYMARALWVVRTKYEWIKWFICWNGFFSSSHSSPLCFAHSEVLWNDILNGVNESVTCVARKYNLATNTHTRTCQSHLERIWSSRLPTKPLCHKSLSSQFRLLNRNKTNINIIRKMTSSAHHIHTSRSPSVDVNSNDAGITSSVILVCKSSQLRHISVHCSNSRQGWAARRLFIITIICCHFYVNTQPKPMQPNWRNSLHVLYICLWSISIWCATFTEQPFLMAPFSTKSPIVNFYYIFLLFVVCCASATWFYANRNIAYVFILVFEL